MVVGADMVEGEERGVEKKRRGGERAGAKGGSQLDWRLGDGMR